MQHIHPSKSQHPSMAALDRYSQQIMWSKQSLAHRYPCIFQQPKPAQDCNRSEKLNPRNICSLNLTTRYNHMPTTRSLTVLISNFFTQSAKAFEPSFSIEQMKPSMQSFLLMVAFGSFCSHSRAAYDEKHNINQHCANYFKKKKEEKGKNPRRDMAGFHFTTRRCIALCYPF